VPGKITSTAFSISSRFPLIARLALVLAASAGFALADTLASLTLTQVDTTQGGSLWMNEDGVSTSVYFAGVIDLALTYGGQTYNRESLCVDLFTDINIGGTYYTDITIPQGVPPKDPEKDLPSVSWLIDEAMLPILYPGKYASALPSQYWISPSNTTAGTAVQRGEAIQLAVWDMTVDGGDGMSKGRVQQSTTANQLTDPVVLNLITFYENAALGQYTNDAFVYINWSGDANQSKGTPAQMLEGPLYTTGPIGTGPEPATFVLVGTALVGIGWTRRRRIGKPTRQRA
jgi:hypothetical protein